MSQIAPAKYLISLCTLAQECQESFGIAMRIGAPNSKFNIEATKVIHSILTFSPSPDTVAVEFLNELEKVKDIAFLGRWSLCVPAGFCWFWVWTVVPVRCRVSQLDCPTWATAVIDFLSNNFTKEERLREIEPLSNLATEMLTHLLIVSMTFLHWLDYCLPLIGAARNPGGKKTPQDTAHLTPDIYRLREICRLLEEAVTNRSQSALKQLVRFYP